MPVVALASIIIVVLLIVLRSSSPTTGYDASYPQCSGPYPSKPLFGIVGVNGGAGEQREPVYQRRAALGARRAGAEAPKQPPLSLVHRYR